jgi:hypothetical protein
MKYVLFFLFVVSQQIVLAQCKAKSVLVTNNVDNTTSNYIIQYDANGNIEAFSNDKMDYVQLEYELLNNKQILTKVFTYKKAMRQHIFLMEYDENNFLTGIQIQDSIFDKKTGFYSYKTKYQLQLKYQNKKVYSIDYLSIHPVLNNGILTEDQLAPESFLYTEHKDMVQKEQLLLKPAISDQSDSYFFNDSCGNSFTTALNNPYFFLLTADAYTSGNNPLLFTYTYLHDRVITNVKTSTIPATKLIEQFAFTYNNISYLKKASIQSFKSSYTKKNNTLYFAGSTKYNFSIEVVYDCGNFDYSNSPTSCIDNNEDTPKEVIKEIDPPVDPKKRIPKKPNDPKKTNPKTKEVKKTPTKKAKV